MTEYPRIEAPQIEPMLARFDFAAFVAAYDAERRARDLTWYDFADALWDQSAVFNAGRDDHRICGGAVSRLGVRGEISCQYALFMLRWLGRAPEDFLVGPIRHTGPTALPEPGSGHRLRWDLGRLHAALDHERREAGLTWAGLAAVIGCTPARLTNLRTARLADLDLVMRLTQWLGRPAADFVDPVAG